MLVQKTKFSASRQSSRTAHSIWHCNLSFKIPFPFQKLSWRDSILKTQAFRMRGLFLYLIFSRNRMSCAKLKTRFLRNDFISLEPRATLNAGPNLFFQMQFFWHMPTVISLFLLYLRKLRCGKLTPTEINWFTIIESFPLSLYIYHISCRTWHR